MICEDSARKVHEILSLAIISSKESKVELLELLPLKGTTRRSRYIANVITETFEKTTHSNEK